MGAAPDYSLLLALAAVMCSALSLYAFRLRHARGAIAFAIQMAAQASWTIAHLGVLLGPDQGTRVLFAQLRFVASGAALVAYLAVVLECTGSRRFLTARTLALLSVVPAVTVLLAFTN